MRKKIALILILALCVGTVACLTACNKSDPGTMSNLVGTYALTEYYATSKKDSNDKTDLKAKNSIEAYVVVGDAGFGYIAVKDKDNGWKADTIQIVYSFNKDDQTKIDSIEYDTHNSIESFSEPVGQKGRLYFNKKKKQLTFHDANLKFTILGQQFGEDYKTDEIYTKVDKATDLSYVRSKTGQNFVLPQWELKNFDGYFNGEMEYFINEDPYVYFLMDLRIGEMKADVYWAMKEDKEPHSALNQTVSYDPSVGMTINGRVYTLGYTPSEVTVPLGSFYTTEEIPSNSDEPDFQVPRRFYRIPRDNCTIDDLIAERLPVED